MTRTASAPSGMAGQPAALLEDKIQVPRPGLAVLHRRRVTELVEAASARRVTVVRGPAGAGKTVALAAWAAARPAARQPAWLTADARDREPASFWRYLTAALARCRPFGPEDAALLSAATPADCPEAIVAVASRLAEPVVLVIDDVHELDGSDALTGLDLLIRHAPAGLRLVLAGRRAAAVSLARLRVAGEVADIGAADLACTAAEADGYLELLGITLPPAERDKLLARAEGWMAGLRLAAMSAVPGRPAAGGVPCATGTQAAVAEYVTDEVLAGQPPEVRRFLQRTSVTASLSGELADELAGAGAAGARTLDRLARENSLVVPVLPAVPGSPGTAAGQPGSEQAGSEQLGPGRPGSGQPGPGQPGPEQLGPGQLGPGQLGPGQPEYRYHPMLREVLAAELRRERPAEVPGLLRRAARWHAGRGRPAEAIMAAAEAGDWDLGAEIVAESGAGFLAGQPGGAAGLAAVLAQFPPERRAGDARVAAGLAAARLWQGDAAGAAPHLECARRSLPALDPRTRQALAPWLAALSVMQAPCRPGAGPGWLAAEWELAVTAEASAASVPSYRAAGLLWLALGCARLRRFELAPARHALSRAAAQLAVGSLPRLRARALAWQALAAASCGDLAAAAATIADVGQDLSQDQSQDHGQGQGQDQGHSQGQGQSQDPGPGDPAARVLALARAELALASDELDTARLRLDEATQPAASHDTSGYGEPVRDAAGQGRAGHGPSGHGAGHGGTGQRAGEYRAGGQLAGEPPVAVIAGLIRARCAIAESDSTAARALLTRLAEASVASQLDFGDVLAGLAADAALAAGDRDRATALNAGTGPARQAAPDGLVRRARLALAAGDDKGALEAAQHCLDQAAQHCLDQAAPNCLHAGGGGSERGRFGSPVPEGRRAEVSTRDRISALLVAAVAHRRLSQVTEAAAAIEQALGLAEPDGAYRVFLDGGPAVRSAMTVLVPPTSGSAGFAGRVLERFDGQVPRHPASSGHGEPPLTSSELAVLRFLPSHMTNQEIAESLFLSINTVKTHLRSAYRKLGVANRRQAIARGRRLDLL